MMSTAGPKRILNARLVGRPRGLFDVQIEDGVVISIEPTSTDEDATSSSSSGLSSTLEDPGSNQEDAKLAAIPITSDERESDPDLDLKGQSYLAPSLMDNHVHFKWWAMSESRTDLSTCNSAQEVLNTMKSVLEGRKRERDASSRNNGIQARGDSGEDPVHLEWVVGQHMRMANWTDLDLLNKSALDTLVQQIYGQDHDDNDDNNIGLVLVFNGFHSLVCNTPALHRFGYTEKDIRGRSGHLQETAAFDALGVVNAMDDSVVDDMVERASRNAAALGVTEIVELEMAFNMIDWKRRIQAGNDLLRVHAGMYQPHLDMAIHEGLKTGDVVQGTRGLVKVGPNKIITDGSLGSRTAFCHHAYPGTNDDYGEWVYEDETLKGMAIRATENGFRLAVHALGDKAISKTLEVLDSLPVKPLQGSSIEHAQLLKMEDRRLFADLGLTASIQPCHMIDDRPLCHKFWPGREDRAFAYRSMVDAGIPLRLGSDCPVAPLQPWEAMAVAVGRTERGFEEDPWHEEQAIDISTAWRGTTWSGKDAIEVGDRADLVVLDKSPLECDASGLRQVEVRGTMLGGRWTYNKMMDRSGDDESEAAPRSK